ESKHWKKANDEIGRCKKDRAQKTVSVPPQKKQSDRGCQGGNEVDKSQSLDLPTRVNKNERMRPEDLSEIKQNIPTGNGQPLHCVQRPIRADRAGKKPLFVNSPPRSQGGNEQKGRD